MDLEFVPFSRFSHGFILDMLIQAYTPIWTDHELHEEIPRWKEYDAELFDNLDKGIARCGFGTMLGKTPVGFAAWFPFRPDQYHVGHNCILPEYQGNGYGTAQMREVLRRIKERDVRFAVVTTIGAPAIRMYEKAGFKIVSKDSFEEPPGWDNPCLVMLTIDLETL